jgi:hypothetical protein
MNHLDPNGIDWVFTGLNGDQDGDSVYREVLSRLFPSGYNQAVWKHLSGEYLSSTAFAMWAASNVLKKQVMPDILRIKSPESRHEIRNILIYNHFKRIHHSFILLSSSY